MILVGIMINVIPLYLEIPNNKVLRTIAASLSGSIGGSIGGSIEQELLTERQTQILNLVQQNPKVSYREMAVQIGINESAIKKHLNHLKDAGWLERVGGTRGYWAIKKEFGEE